MSRRSLVIGAAAFVAGAAVLGRKPDRGGTHSDYFRNLSLALKDAGIAQPVLVIDRARLDANIAAARKTLKAASAEERLTITGLMGYDAHVPRVPLVDRAYRASHGSYAAAIEVLRLQPGVRAELTLNAAGSPTYAMHAKRTVANEVSVGSAFVKPTGFDIDTLAHHVPAAFIATPVLKALDRSLVPGVEWLTGARRLIDPNTQRAFYSYGGHWLAKPESPPGLQFSDLVGRSSNQELLLGSKAVNLQPDDYIFFRPTQSEAVLLQFGDILVYENARITDRWPTFAVSA